MENKVENLEAKKKKESIEKILEKKWEAEIRKYGFSGETLKHLTTLKRYYDIDFDKRVITIPFHFKHVDEIVEIGVGKESNPVIKRSWLAKISSLAHNIPYEFKIQIDLKIDDYAGYEHANIAKSILDAFEMFHFDLKRKQVNSSLKLVVLVVAGVILFAWLFYLCSKHWFGKSGEPVHDTIHELVVTLATVFIWESVYIAFIYDNSYENISGKLLNRIKTIKLFDSKNVLLNEITNKNMVESWSVDTKFETVCRGLMFLAAIALLCISGCKAIDVIEVFIKYKDQGLALASANVTLVIVVMGILGGLGAISYYRDKGPLKKFLLAFAIIELVLNSSDMILSALALAQQADWALKSLILSTFMSAISSIFVMTAFVLRNRDKKNKKMSIETIQQM